jgi:hypothetical protein
MMAYVELKLCMNDKAYLHYMYRKVKDRIQEKTNSYNQIKMCTCMNVVDVLRWPIAPEWVLLISFFMNEMNDSIA